jgi:tetratricopeptide (TPR) repeat protein
VLLAWSKMEGGFKNFDRARSLMHQALEISPDDAKCLQQLGAVEQGSNRIEEARRLFQAATLADPSYAGAYASWGRLERQQGRLDRAREVLGRGLGATQGGVQFGLLVEAAVLERVAGNAATAREMAGRADEASDPPRSSSIPQQILGMVERSVGHTSAARSAFRTALDRNPRCAGTAREWAVLESEAAQDLKRDVRTSRACSLTSSFLQRPFFKATRLLFCDHISDTRVLLTLYL